MGRRVIAALLACLLLGGHWASLQVIAWANMLADRVQTMSVADAVKTTFDGDHPCPMCKAITKAKQEEKSADSAKKVVFDGRVLQAVISPIASVLPPVPALRLHVEDVCVAASIDIRPDVPPPRSAA